MTQLFFVALSAVFVGGVVLAGKYAACTQEGKEAPRQWLIYVALTFMLLIRIALAVTVKGYPADVQTFQAWAIQAAKDLPGFYSSGMFADYPPGYMYVLFLIGKTKEVLLVGNDSPAFLALIKMPAILADMVTVFLVYRLASTHRGRRYALAVALIYGFNPAIIINSAAWGQVDAVFSLFIALSVISLTKDWLIRSAILFALALLIKPQALIFSPLFLCAASERLLPGAFSRNWKKMLISASAGIAVFIVFILPFALKEEPFWIFKHYAATLASYPYATLNAFNLFALSGGNFKPETDILLVFSYRAWGAFFIVAATLFAVAVYVKGRREVRMYYMALFLISAVFVLASKMHERYLFPALIFALLAFLYSQDRKMLALFAGYSVTHFMNVAQVLIAGMQGNHIHPFNPFLIAISALNLLLLGCTVAYGIKIQCQAKVATALLPSTPIKEPVS